MSYVWHLEIGGLVTLLRSKSVYVAQGHDVMMCAKADRCGTFTFTFTFTFTLL